MGANDLVSKLLQVGEAAKQLGLNSQMLYFYERTGLISPPQRTAAGYRLLNELDMSRLRFITRVSDVNYTGLFRAFGDPVKAGGNWRLLPFGDLSMELLQSLLPSVSLLRLDSYELETGDHHLTLHLCSTQTVVPCPLCGKLTQRIHSRYERTLADLPCIDFSLTLIVQVCKFFCLNSDCRRRIFAERLPEVAAPWARKTIRFVQRLQSLALALGGAAGARLGVLLDYASCGSTLLNHLRALPLPAFETPRILGVDDFAFRKGHNYGTVLVDLETHQPISLLADRKAETLAEWLQAHPGIAVLSRDRSKTYKSAMLEGAPDAIQVDDRFHLVKNLSEMLERAFGSYRAELKAAEQSQQQATVVDAPEETVIAGYG